jgi:hypothetical protein
MCGFVLDAQVEVAHLQFLRPASNGGGKLARQDRRFDARLAQTFNSHPVPDRKLLHDLPLAGIIDPRVGEHAVAVREDERDAGGARAEEFR